jgi:GT2 family glycosyltransferase
MSGVYVVVINWNGWRDTMECLESVFRSDYPDYKVIVCDNNSGDNSLEYLKAWAEQRLNIVPNSKNGLTHLYHPPMAKPIPYTEYNRADAEGGGHAEDRDARLILIRGDANIGFAGGNNVGMRYALVRGDFEYIWLLNNDTVVEPDALSKMVARMKESTTAGMCGSTLLHYNNPDQVQARGGGYYCKWVGLPWHMGRLSKASVPADRNRVEGWMNYVVGASLLVSRRFLLDVGLMCEDYFLFFEEADWAIRAKGRHQLAYAPESIVYHKIGGSIGTSSNPKEKSAICDYYNVRNRLLFTRRFFPYALPAIYLAIVCTLMTRAFLGKWDRVMMIIRLMYNYNTSWERPLDKHEPLLYER